MNWLLAPLSKHADDGFGAMGTAFSEGADLLMAAGTNSVVPRELPTCFLLRHACELYLKSALVVGHRKLALASGLPTVEVDGKPRPLKVVHGLAHLYDALVVLLTEHGAKLATIAKTEWLPMPPELDAAIAAIDSIDRGSTHFRYPTGNDSGKSANKPMSTDELQNWNTEQSGYLKAFLLLNAQDEVIEAFRYDPTILAAELTSLKIARNWLNCFHVGLRMELAEGW